MAARQIGMSRSALARPPKESGLAMLRLKIGL